MHQFDGNGIIRSIHHWHPLAIIGKACIDHVKCFLCGGLYSDSAYYGCKKCGTFFHKSCAELPGEIRHLCHNEHTLSLISQRALDSTRRRCSFCFKDLPSFPHYGGVYYCKECNVQLDMACATSAPSIEYQGHAHFLTIVEKTHRKGICHVCHSPCIGFDVLFCTECKFSLHIKCGPLPCTIKHPSHVHRLLLQDYYDKDNETDEFPCHDCENKRDPKERVYVCSEGCQMIIELKCAAFEVIQALMGKRGDVELRSEFPYIACKLISKDFILEKMEIAMTSRSTSGKTAEAESTFSYGEVIESLRGSDSRYVADLFKNVHQHHERVNSEDSNESIAKDEYMLSCDAWFDFSASLISPLPVEKITELFERHDGSAKASDHFHNLPQTLVPMYENAANEYNIFAKDCALNRQIQSVLVFYLCAVLYDMRITKVVDITVTKLRQWLTILHVLQDAGLHHGYATASCWHIAKAHFVIQAKASVDEILNNLRGEVKQLSESVEELEGKLQAVKDKIAAVVKKRKDHEAKKAAGMREFREDYREALLIKWKPTSDAFDEIKKALCP